MKIPLSDSVVDAAAIVIDRELRSYGHFAGLPTHEETIENDPIGANEFRGIIERAILAAIEADKLTD